MITHRHRRRIYLKCFIKINYDIRRKREPTCDQLEWNLAKKRKPFLELIYCNFMKLAEKEGAFYFFNIKKW